MKAEDLPKIELHLHLEGAAPPAFMSRLAAEKGLDLSSVIDGDTYIFNDFPHFLKVYEAVSAALQTPDDYRRLTEAVLAASRDQGVIYTEVFVAPSLMGKSLDDWPDFLAGIEAGAAAVPGITCRFIALAVRHMGPLTAEDMARKLVANPGSMVGFNMGGLESHMHPIDFARAFDIAREAGLGITIHAGEVCGAQSVRAALDAVRPARIGHGVRAIDDAGLVRRIVEEGVVLEVCPGSNLALGLYADLPHHPISALREAGAKVTVSTDDPPYFHTTMRQEYHALADLLGWSLADFRQINDTALAAAFCDEATRARIAARLEEQWPSI